MARATQDANLSRPIASFLSERVQAMPLPLLFVAALIRGSDIEGVVGTNQLYEVVQHLVPKRFTPPLLNLRRLLQELKAVSSSNY